jgi:phosphomannomutase
MSKALRKLASCLVLISFFSINTVYAGSINGSTLRVMASAVESAAGLQEGLIYGEFLAPVTRTDLNTDMFRDYDYRTRGQEIDPRIAFRMGIVWAQMALEKAEEFNISGREVVFAQDCRDLNPKIAEAVIAGLRYSGLDVIFISETTRSTATTYSWAVIEHRPLMGIFMTASHVVGEGVSGFKVSIQNETGELQSLSTHDIKVTSYEIVQKLIDTPEIIDNVKGSITGQLRNSDVEDASVDFVTLIGRIAVAKEGEYTVAGLTEAVVKSDDPLASVRRIASEIGDSMPLSGIKVVVEAAHTPSGETTRRVFENLGAEVIMLHGDARLLKGMHKADPSKPENLEGLKDEMARSQADFGLAFDLDGDRGAIIIPNEQGGFDTLSPDNLMASMLRFLMEKCGYAGYENIAIVRDVLSTRGVDDAARVHGILPEHTDAGYVFLKERVRALEARGYIVPVYGERSGHTWLDITGAFENPIALAVLFAVMNMDPMYKYEPVPYQQSPRFQPEFHPELLSILSVHEGNDTGWNASSEIKPPQKIIALGKDYGIRELAKVFYSGAKFDTPIGRVAVDRFNTYQDSEEAGGFYRFADIEFTLNGEFVGRFVFRASSNDPTFVSSFEAAIHTEDTPQETRLRYDSIGGLVLHALEELELASITGVPEDVRLTLGNFRENMGISGFQYYRTSSAGIVLSVDDLDMVNQQAGIVLQTVNLSDATGTIVYDDTELSTQQQDILKGIIGSSAQSLADIEERLGCTVRLMSELMPTDIKDMSSTIIISGAKLDSYPKARYLLIEQAQIDNSYIAVIPFLAIAKGLLGLEDITQQPDLYNALKHAILSLSKGQLSPGDVEGAINAYMAGNPLLIALPPAQVYDYEYLEALQRAALRALIAA